MDLRSVREYGTTIGAWLVLNGTVKLVLLLLLQSRRPYALLQLQLPTLLLFLVLKLL